MRNGQRFGLILSTILLAALAASGCNNDKGKTGSGVAPKPTSDKPAPTGSGVIQGTVKFAGTVPAPEDWGGTSSSDCRALHPGTIQLVKVQR